MIAATVTTAASAVSLFDLIETATPDQLSQLSSGRIAEVHIQWASGTFHLVYKDGTVNAATDSGFEFADPVTNPAKGLMVIRGASGMNVLSLKDIYLGAGVGTARVAAYTV